MNRAVLRSRHERPRPPESPHRAPAPSPCAARPWPRLVRRPRSKDASGGVRRQHGSTPNAQEASPPGDIPDNQVAFVPYRRPGGGYIVKVPEGWSRTQAGVARSFTDKLNRVDVPRRRRAGHRGARSAHELPPSRHRSRASRSSRSTTVTRTAGPAIRAAYLADRPPDPVTGKVGDAGRRALRLRPRRPRGRAHSCRRRRAPTTSTRGGRHRLPARSRDERRCSRRRTSTASSTPATTRRSPCGASHSPSKPASWSP